MIRDGRGASGSPRLAVLLSEQLMSVGAGLDLALLQDWLVETTGSWAQLVADPARRPGQIASAVAESKAERLVLGLAPGEFLAGSIQSQARRAGLDPLGVEVVNLGAHAALLGPRPVAMERAKLQLAGAIAKARAFGGSGPEHLRLAIGVAVNRRALFTMSVKEYRTVPSVSPERCFADRGCRRCVDACPERALRYRGRGIELTKERCASCGLCLATCPSGAVAFPGYSPPELDAQIAALADPGLGDLSPRGVLFVCRSTAAALELAVERGCRYPGGWLPVAVPCVGMLPASSLLRPLAVGVDGVGVVPCGGQCPLAQDALVAERVAFCTELLALMSPTPDRVKLCPWPPDDSNAWELPPMPSDASMEPLRMGRPSGPRDAAEMILFLAEAHGAPAELRLRHEASPLGTIDVDVEGCTACGCCVEACPTGALAIARHDDDVAISFDAALCSGCGICVPWCPEAERGVLRVERGIDRRRLEAGRVTPYRETARRCAACGSPIAPAAMMTRLAALLGDEYAALATTIARYCSSCRGVPLGPPAIRLPVEETTAGRNSMLGGPGPSAAISGT